MCAGSPLGSSKRRIGLGLSGMYCAACSITIEKPCWLFLGWRSRFNLLLSALASCSTRPGSSYQIWFGRFRLWATVPGLMPLRGRGHERLQRAPTFVVAAFRGRLLHDAGDDDHRAAVRGWPHEIPADIWRLMNWACWVLSVPVMLFSCGPFFSGAWRAASSAACPWIRQWPLAWRPPSLSVLP